MSDSSGMARWRVVVRLLLFLAVVWLEAAGCSDLLELQPMMMLVEGVLFGFTSVFSLPQVGFRYLPVRLMTAAQILSWVDGAKLAASSGLAWS